MLVAIVKRGKNTYLVRIYIGHDPKTKKRIQVNKTVHGTLSDAKKQEAVLKAKKRTDLLKATKISVDALLDLYLDANRHTHSENTKNKNTKYAKYYVRPFIGHMLVENIKTSHILKLLNSLLDDDYARSTVRGVRKLLSGLFNFAVTDKYIAENPVPKAKVPAVNHSVADSLTLEEANAFVAAKDKYWYGCAFVFQLHTGLRPQELLALTWDDIDFNKGSVRVERACKWLNEVFIGFGPPKRERSIRTITISPEVVSLLRLHLKTQDTIINEYKSQRLEYGEPKIMEWIERERPKQKHFYKSINLVFPSRLNGTVPQAAVPRREFKAMLQQAGINRPSLRFYDLRHTHATILLSAGAPPHEVAERLGNTTNELLTTYAHVLPERRGIAATLFQSLVPV